MSDEEGDFSGQSSDDILPASVAEITDAVRALARQRPSLDLAEQADRLADPLTDTQRAVEAMIFASATPVKALDIAARLGEDADVGEALVSLKRHYRGRGIQLVEVAGGWLFQTSPDLAPVLEERRETVRKLSTAALETLSIIAYHQPCTRAEIEAVRAVAVGRGTLDLLMEIGWVRPGARRRSPGKPLTYRTTPAFLTHFNLASLDDLPGKADLQAQGLLDVRLPPDFDVPRPQDVSGEHGDEEVDGDGRTEQPLFTDDFLAG